MIDWNLLAISLTTRFGIEISVSSNTANKGLLRVEGIEPPNGFGIEISMGWRSVQSTFKPDTFAAALIRTIRDSSKQQQHEFSVLSDAFKSQNLNIQLKLRGSIINPYLLQQQSLDQFELQCTRLSDRTDDQLIATEAATACLALVLTLLPLEYGVLEEEIIGYGANEGGLTRTEVNKYERSPANRAAAIAIHGVKCNVCDFEFEEKYGVLGSGFIEIHHKLPVSRMGPNYAVDPSQDLVPLCANCHRMIHKSDPPMSTEDLRKLLR